MSKSRERPKEYVSLQVLRYPERLSPGWWAIYDEGEGWDQILCEVVATPKLSMGQVAIKLPRRP